MRGRGNFDAWLAACGGNAATAVGQREVSPPPAQITKETTCDPRCSPGNALRTSDRRALRSDRCDPFHATRPGSGLCCRKPLRAGIRGPFLCRAVWLRLLRCAVHRSTIGLGSVGHRSAPLVLDSGAQPGEAACARSGWAIAALLPCFPGRRGQTLGCSPAPCSRRAALRDRRKIGPVPCRRERQMAKRKRRRTIVMLPRKGVRRKGRKGRFRRPMPGRTWDRYGPIDN